MGSKVRVNSLEYTFYADLVGEEYPSTALGDLLEIEEGRVKR